ncbi:YbaN family protein [Zobellella maritima]|uniref:YbaN family protein n=1 Tax=Zobellella maritima TaxID=2059725 RepID=UPI000E302F3F|nr:YbaN family protein [Zobellella maritima]
MRILFALLGSLSLGLGVLGAFLPVLPTTPFVLLSAFLFGKSSPRVHSWLLHHPWFGGMIQDWQQCRGLRPRVRRRALLLMSASFAFSIYMVPLWWVKIGLVLTYIALLVWFLRLPLLPDRPAVAMKQPRP